MASFQEFGGSDPREYVILFSIGIYFHLNIPLSFLSILIMDVILHILQLPVSIIYDWVLNVSFYFISRHTFVLNINFLIRLGIHRPIQFHSPNWVYSACIFWMFPSHVCCFAGRKSLGSEPSTAVGTLLFLTSMPNTLNFCNRFGGLSKERGNPWIYFLCFSWNCWEKVAIKGYKEAVMCCLYSRRFRGVWQCNAVILMTHDSRSDSDLLNGAFFMF